ncbi:MAG: phytoene/squalene synthase family protein [Candidatus ainarchaeum sp.]|nr:phytoene/squalene synthase family protein [Candidatus ainarchaeum sp.]
MELVCHAQSTADDDINLSWEKTSGGKIDFRYAEESIKKGSKTFYFASRFMGQESRNAFHAVYAFCRQTDDLVDNNEGNPRLQKMLVRDWRKRLRAAYDSGFSDDPILAPFVHVMKKYSIPLRYPLQLIKGVSMDISRKAYGTFAELRRYCYHVASVVGIMLMYIFGADNLHLTKRHAIKLGIAMQLTNILRDVGEDARMGRVYFPKDELARFGLAIEDILSLRKTENLIRFLKFQVARARRYYEEALEGLRTIHKEARTVIFMSFTLYREILRVIEENGYEVYTRRAYVALHRKVLLYFNLLIAGSPPALAPTPAA